METVGMIGVGLVGTAIAERLIAAGHRVLGHDVSPEQLENLARLGGNIASGPGDVFAVCERVILSLPTSAIVMDVIHASGTHLRRGGLVIDTTTGAPEDALACARVLDEAGLDYMDATVGGSSQQVRTREAIFICGGSPEAVARAMDILDLCAKQTFHVGPAASGARMKLVLNLVLGLNRAVLAEGLEFARASGIDPYAALEILKSGPAYSRAMDTKGRRMLDQAFEPEARLSQHLKDVRLILDSGARMGAWLPLSQLHRDLLESAEANGFGALDNSAIIKAWHALEQRR